MSSASRGCTTRAEEIRRISTRARGDPGCPRPPEGSHARDVTDRISGTGAILGLGRPSAPPEAAAHYGHIRGRTGEPTPAHGGPEWWPDGAASLGHRCRTGAGGGVHLSGHVCERRDPRPPAARWGARVPVSRQCPRCDPRPRAHHSLQVSAGGPDLRALVSKPVGSPPRGSCTLCRHRSCTGLP